MKQIIPFKKDLLFKTKVSEITSISLEHTLTLKEDDLISGEFYITGDYKMTEGSINREKFDFKLPFDIALDSRYDVGSIVIDIDNFYYEIVNNESLQVNIDVYVEGEKIEEVEYVKEDVLEEKEDVIEPSVILEKSKEVFFNDEDENVYEDRNEKMDINNLFKEDYGLLEGVNKLEMYEVEKKKEKEIKEEFNLFENINNSDTYVTYYVYLVKEGDTLDNILNKYGVTKEDLSHYNDLENINPGMKMIIPSCNNE